MNPSTTALIVAFIGAAGPLVQAAVASWLDNAPKRRLARETQQTATIVDLLERVLRLEQTIKQSSRSELQSVTTDVLAMLVARLTGAKQTQQTMPEATAQQMRWRRYLLLTAPTSAWGILARILLFVFGSIFVLTFASLLTQPTATPSVVLFGGGVLGIPAALAYYFALKTSKSA